VLDEVTKVFPGGTVAIDRLSLDVADGEFIVLVGPSGCGKSTVLRMVAGLEDVTSGTIAIDGDVVNDLPPKDRDVAMIFQSYALYPHMTVSENLAFSLRINRMPKQAIREKVADTSVVLGLDELLGRKPAALSGGQRQRVAMGRAIVRHPRVFLMDEPLSNLDAKLRVAMRGELSRLHHRYETTTLYVTHDQIEAMTLGNRIAVLDRGRLQQVGTPDELYEAPCNVFVAGFIGSPAMNLAAGVVTEGPAGLTLVVGDYRWPIPPEQLRRRPALRGYAGKEVVFGVRPHHLAQPTEATALDAPRLRFRAVTVESLGSERNVLFVPPFGAAGPVGVTPTDPVDVQTELWTARLGSTAHVRSGEEVELTIDLSNAYFFDATTTEAIPALAGAASPAPVPLAGAS
jgi:multiple sugar transport system ATP-binding protein